MLYQASFATDQDVRAGEADERGELVYSTSLCINFCPYCGERLITPLIADQGSIK